jgi:hypothetical protein
MFISIIPQDPIPPWVIEAQFSTGPNWASDVMGFVNCSGHEHPGGVGADVVAQIAQLVLLGVHHTLEVAEENGPKHKVWRIHYGKILLERPCRTEQQWRF